MIWVFPKNRGTPKWMVKIMENPIKMDDLGGKPTIFGNIHIYGIVWIIYGGVGLGHPRLEHLYNYVF